MDTEILNLIKKQCQGKPHIKLTVGCLANGSQTVQVFNESGEIENKDYPTIKRLLTHTSGYTTRLPMSRKENLQTGLSPMTNALFSSMFYMDEQKMRDILSRTDLTDKDYKWHYSNFGFSLLGYAAGVVSGEGYTAAMDKFLADDLGLPNSYTGTLPEKNLPGFSKKDRSGGNVNWGDNLVRPAGDISSTAKDLLRYAEIHMNEELPYVSVCHQKHAKHGFPFAQLLDIDMGLGWWVGRKEPLIMHGGDTATFSSALIADKKHKTAAVVLSNYPGNSLNLSKIAIPLLKKTNQNIGA